MTDDTDADGTTESNEGVTSRAFSSSVPTTYKIRGKFEDTEGTAVFGYNESVSGATEGVHGRVDTDGDGGVGVYGEAAGLRGTTYGVKGTTASDANAAAGVYGEASSPSSDGAGVVAVGKGTGFTSLGQRFPAAGVRATATNSTGVTAGVHGINDSFGDGNAGVEGETTKTSGRTYGVRGRIRSGETGAAGVYGESADSGETYGLKGVASSPDGYGVYTPDDAKLEGDLATTSGHTVTVDGDRGLRVGPTGTDTTDSGVTYTIGGSIVGGYQANTANGALGATIAGGGGERAKNSSDILISEPNEVTDRFGTVGGGAANQAGDAKSGTTNADYATVGGGLDNLAGTDRSGSDTGVAATVGGGFFNTASASYATVGGGVENTASAGFATVGGGFFNTASGDRSTVPGGDRNTASGDYSFAAGRKAKANHDGSFVWADSRHQDFTSNGPDQFVIEADGGVGIGTNTPFAKLEVANAVSGDAFDDPSKHVAIVDNTADNGSANALAIKAGPSGDPPTSVNFVSFYNGQGSSYGALQGNGTGGTELKSTGSDYAEYLPKRDPDRAFEAGDVVGVEAGQLVADASQANRAMVVSWSHVVLGNDPGESDDDHEPVAFTGQVPVKVRGPVEAGDLLVPSGEADGTARAVAPGEWQSSDGPLVGQAWESDDTAGVGDVTVAVGIDDPTLLAASKRRVRDLEATIESLRTELAARDDRIESQRDRIDDLESRLAALEARLDGADERGSTTTEAPR